MSKICPNCKREIDEKVKFCPFCAAFTGETPQEKKKSPVGAIIGGAAGVLALGAASLAVFVFDVFGMYGDKAETLYGTGDKLFIQFGHNDEKPDVDRATDAHVTYPEYLGMYIDAARRQGADGFAGGRGCLRHAHPQGSNISGVICFSSRNRSAEGLR